MDFDQTPAAEGFFMPAEWGAHERCWMAWPCRTEIWGGEEGLMRARQAYGRVARAISGFEPVVMVARPEDAREAALVCGGEIEVMPLPIDDSWMRDSGPVFVVDAQNPTDRRVAGIDWSFNAWGNKYHGFDHDDAVPASLLSHLKMRRFSGPMVLEGGAFSVDGEGTLLTTEECLLNSNRNPNLEQSQIEERLAFHLGVSKIIWVPQGLVDDETDGHIDNLAVFVSPGRVALHMPEDPADPNRARMQSAAEILRNARDAAGRSLDVIEIPAPPVRHGPYGQLPLSYLNFYFANNALIMPAFGCEADVNAARLLKELCPDRDIIQVDASDIVVGGGGIHCITQQQPKGQVAEEIGGK